MKYTSKFNELLNLIKQEAEQNPEFEKKLNNFFGVDEKTSKKRKRNVSPFNPVKYAETGRDTLKFMLQPLDIEVLKDIVSDYGMDSKRLVMKWKDKDKIIEHILNSSEARAKKGDAFRKNMFEYEKLKVESHQIYKKYLHQINKLGIEDFLKSQGIFANTVPFYQHPTEGGKLIGFHINVQYRIKKINDEKWEMGFFEDYITYKNLEEANTQAILKSFEIIENRREIDLNI